MSQRQVGTMTTHVRFGRDFGQLEVPLGTTLLAAATRAGAPLGNACRAQGVCQACAVLPIEGAQLLTAAGEIERAMALSPGWRMACQTRVSAPGRLILWTPNWGGSPD